VAQDHRATGGAKHATTNCQFALFNLQFAISPPAPARNPLKQAPATFSMAARQTVQPIRRVAPFTFGGDCWLGFFRCFGFLASWWKRLAWRAKMRAPLSAHHGAACLLADVFFWSQWL